MRSATNSFNWFFHSERYLSSTCSLLDQVFCIETNGFQKHCFCCFPVDPAWSSIFWSFNNKFPQFGILYDAKISSDNMAMWFIAKLRFITLESLWIRETFKFERAGAKLNNLLATVLVYSYDTVGGSLSLK